MRSIVNYAILLAIVRHKNIFHPEDGGRMFLKKTATSASHAVRSFDMISTTSEHLVLRADIRSINIRVHNHLIRFCFELLVFREVSTVN
jgi:hypothetical protein